MTVLTGGRVVDPATRTDAVLDIGFEAGKLVRLGRFTPAAGDTVIQAKGKVVTPWFRRALPQESVDLYGRLAPDSVTEKNALPAALTLLVHTGHLDMSAFVALFSPSGSLAVGEAADLLIFDELAETGERLAGLPLRGVLVEEFVNGERRL